MKWIAEIIIFLLLSFSFLSAYETYTQSDEFCYKGDPAPKDGLTRGELLVFNILIRPGMALGCYFADDADPS